MTIVRRLSSPFLLFIVLWMVLFALPRTRWAALSQWKQRLTSSSLVSSSSQSSRDEEFVRALEPRPYMTGGTDPPTTQATDFETLEGHFPGDPSIYAAHIAALSGNLDASLYKLMVYSPQSLRFVAPSSSVASSTAVFRFLRSWFTTAKRGAQLEPDNTFWDWAQILGLLAAHRDNEVWSLLRAASRKARYDDYGNEGVLAHLRLQRRQGLVSPLGQLETYNQRAYGVGFDQWPLSQAVQQLRQTASDRYASGTPSQRKQALESMRDLLLLGRTMRLHAQSTTSSVYGQMVEGVAFYGLSPNYSRWDEAHTPKLGPSLSTYASNPHSLLLVARQMNRPDIAAQLGREWNNVGTWRGHISSAVVSSPFFGLDQQALWPALVGDWLGTLLLASIPTLLVFALACSVLLRIVPAWKQEASLPLPVWTWPGASLLTLVGVLVLCAPILYAMWIAWGVLGLTALGIFIPPTPLNLNGIPASWCCHFATVLIVPLSLWGAAVWNERRQNKPSLLARVRALPVAPGDDLARFDLSPLLCLIGAVAACTFILGGVVAFLVLTPLSTLSELAGVMLFLLAFVPSFFALWQLRTPAALAFALVLARRLAWGQLVCLTLLWGLLWLGVAPAHERFDASFERKARLGEIQLARKQAGL